MSFRNKRGRVLRRSVLAIAVGLCMTSGASYAQSRSAGSIFGNAQAGDQVTVHNEDTGLTRTLTVDNSGRFQASELPLGRYTVTLQHDGQSAGSRENVMVGVGGTQVDFNVQAQELGTVTVVASALPAIDVSSVSTDTLLTAETLNKVPVARDITQAAVLAPSVIPADSRYGNSVSFGGSAASENAYFINGFPVTNPLTNIGSTTLPFDAISSEQVITGGYSARYGRSTGGVINVVTKSGSNTWKAGALVTWEPQALRSDRKDLKYASDTGYDSAGTVYQNRSNWSDNPFTYGVYASGPVIKDRLFVYASGEWNDNISTFNDPVGNDPATGFYRDSEKKPRWMTKVDWNINDSNILEFTGISDKTGINRKRYSYDFDTNQHGTEQTGGYRYKDGGETYVGKYTGYLTDTLTLSALYGKQDITHYSEPYQYDGSQVRVIDDRPITDKITGLQPYTYIDDPDAYDKTDGYRIDLEWRLGDHTLSGGYDVMNSESQTATLMSGPGYAWIYAHTDGGDIPSSGGLTTAPGSDYVYRYIYENGGQFKVEQKAYYIEDRWQLTDRWLLSLGLRNDSFSNYNSDGVKYVGQDNQWAPRLGFSWDVNGDSSLKIFANAGRYFLALPLNVAVRGAAGSTYTTEFFSFTGVDPVTGAPTGLTALGDGPYSSNNEYGQAPDPRTVAASNLKSHYQDEFILGMQQMLGPKWNWGARLQYRDLKSAIDDICDNRPMLEYMAENNIAVDPDYNYSPDCRLFNPGADNVLLLDLPDAAGSTDLVAVPYTKANTHMSLKRKYIGLDLFLEHPFDGTWFGRIDYTLSHNYGNHEGQLDSDIGQQDVSQTVLFDHYELMEYGGGNLPNDRRHVVKAYGFWQMNPEWRFGGTLVARTGRPKSCLGYNPQGSDFWTNNLDYGRYYHYCGGQPVPRGSRGRLPTDFQLSFNAAYMPSWAPGLQFQVDVLNVLNKQVAQSIEERGERGGLGTVAEDRNRVLSYDQPRTVRFMARYDFSL